MSKKLAGKSEHPKIYNSWRAMKNRCDSKNASHAKYYSLKGVSLCQQWRAFDVFLSWALENGFKEGLSIDRIDVSGNYEPTNCRWSTSKEQTRNQTKNRLISANGKTQCVSAWSEETGISQGLILARIDRLGWLDVEAVTVPVGVIPSGPKPKAWAAAC
jgi:hypothetical protein